MRRLDLTFAALLIPLDFLAFFGAAMSAYSLRSSQAFIEIRPGQDGLCHVSELAEKFVKNPTDVVTVGDTLKVKVISIDDQGRVKLSRKAVLRDEKEQSKS